VSEPGPVLPVRQLDGGEVHIHIDLIVKITPSDPEPAPGSGSKSEAGSTITVATRTGTASIGVTEYLLHRGPEDLAGFLRLTDFHDVPIKVNPTYVVLFRPHQPSGTVLEVHSAAGTEELCVQESLAEVSEWWAMAARDRLSDPFSHG
jgi:hypothetical protein